jgi:two-component system, OmpR family, sensor kinase
MTPRSVSFWRMASFVAAALLLFSALAVGSLALVASQELANYTATKHGTLGRQAARVLRQRGVEGLADWLRRDAPIPDDVTVYVLDSRGADILGRTLPSAYRTFIERSVVRPAADEDASFRPARLAPLLMAPDGTRLSFLVLPNRIGLLGSRATLLGVLIAALLVIAGIAWAIARTFARPLGSLQSTVREFASGDTAARVPESIRRRPDELGALGRDFDSMAERIAALLETRRRLMGELSHELRSPLARLRAGLGLATHRGSLSEHEASQFEREIARMDRLIGDLLRYSRLEAAAPPERRLVRLNALVGEIVDDARVEAGPSNRTVALDLTGELHIVGDPALLRSGIENVLRNALRHAPEGSTINVRTAHDGEDASIEVLDRGPGVPDEWLQKIFDPFVRVPGGASSEAAQEGSGLGLAIAQRVFTVHAGRIDASARDGGGLCVTMRLPVAQFA